MEHKDYKLAAIMFTDIVGFSRMMEEDEKGTLQTLDVHNQLVRTQVEAHRGGVIKTIGDAFLVQFQTCQDAVLCAMEVQKAIRAYNQAGAGKPLTLRIGVHLGDIYFYENDALGEGINIASRLQSASKPGRITISREVYSQVSGKVPMRVESLGQISLKNISREVHAYEIILDWDNEPMSVPYPASEKAKTSQTFKSIKEDTPPPEPETSNDCMMPSMGFGPPPRFNELRSEWRNLRRQFNEGRRTGRFQFDIDAQSIGPAIKGAIEEVVGAFTKPKKRPQNPDGSPKTDFQLYKERALRDAQANRDGFLPHLFSFIGVNGFLCFLNLWTSPGFLWFLFPLGGWGIGLVSQMAAAKVDGQTIKELESIQSLSDEDTKSLKKFQNGRSGFWTHLFSNISVVAFLAGINLTVGGPFPWWMIAAAAMGIGILGHLGGYVKQISGFKKFWKGLKDRGFRSANPIAASSPADIYEDPIIAQARTMKDSILRTLGTMKGANPFGDDVTLTLDNYVNQIGELTRIQKEIQEISLALDPSEIDREEASAKEKMARAGSEKLQLEYKKSLDDLDRQRKSFKDLKEQEELLALRISSAVKNLRQMQIDVARVKTLSDGQKEGYFTTLKDRTAELGQYVEDYRKGLEELE